MTPDILTIWAPVWGPLAALAGLIYTATLTRTPKPDPVTKEEMDAAVNQFVNPQQIAEDVAETLRQDQMFNRTYPYTVRNMRLHVDARLETW